MSDRQRKPFPLEPKYATKIKSIFDLATDSEATNPIILRSIADTLLTPTETTEVERDDRKIEFNGVKVNITVLRPLGSKDKELPVVLYMHGGGWVFGSFESYGVLPIELTVAVPACVIFISYSLSPEAKYPVALEECYATLCWIQQNASEINVDLKRLAVLGDSAGGNLAAALTILAKQRNNNGISYQVLYYPIVNAINNKQVFFQNKDRTFKPNSMIQYCWDVYLDDESQYNLPTVSPLTAPLSMLQGLPPAFILSCDQDVYYLAEDELYAKRLMSAGVAVTSVRYNNIDHGYLTMPQLTAYTMTSISHTAQILRDFWAPPRAKL